MSDEFCRSNRFYQHEIYLAGFKVHTSDFDAQSVAQTITRAGALACHFMARLVIIEVIVAQLGDVQQAFHINPIQRHKQTKTGNAGHRAIKFLTDFILHVIALEPCLYIACGVIRTPLGYGTMLA